MIFSPADHIESLVAIAHALKIIESRISIICLSEKADFGHEISLYSIKGGAIGTDLASIAFTRDEDTPANQASPPKGQQERYLPDAFL